MPIVANNIGEVRIKVDTKVPGRIIGVKNNMLIKEIDEKKIGDKQALILTCDLLTTYMQETDKPVSQFLLEEEVLYTDDEKNLKEVMDEWKKNKKLPKKFEDNIIKGLNTICMYDMQFFTNRMRFPPCTGYDIKPSVVSEKKNRKKRSSLARKNRNPHFFFIELVLPLLYIFHHA